MLQLQLRPPSSLQPKSTGQRLLWEWEGKLLLARALLCLVRALQRGRPALQQQRPLLEVLGQRQLFCSRVMAPMLSLIHISEPTRPY